MAAGRDMGGAGVASLLVHACLALWLVSRPKVSREPPTDAAPVIEFSVVADQPGREGTAPDGDGDGDGDIDGDGDGDGDRDRETTSPVPPPARSRAEVGATRPPRVRRDEAGRPRSVRAIVADPAPEAPGSDIESAGAGALRMRGVAPRAALDSIGRGAASAGRSVPGAERRSWMPGEARGGSGRGGLGLGLGRPSGNGTTTHDQPGFRAVVRRDGRVDLQDKPNIEVEYGGIGPGAIIVGGHFDLTDWVERLAGNDPYAYEKHRFLERTREQRAALLERDEREQRREATMRLRGHLRALWEDDNRPIAQRRRLLFELWDECDVDAAGPLGEAAVLARATIEGFIRRRLPKGDEAAFSANEVARLNRVRTSRARFAPYESP